MNKKYYLLRDKESDEDNVIAVVAGGVASDFNARVTTALEEHFDISLESHPLDIDLSKVTHLGSHYAIDVAVYGVQDEEDVAYDITVEQVILY
jgi:hypothetical protein